MLGGWRDPLVILTKQGELLFAYPFKNKAIASWGTG